MANDLEREKHNRSLMENIILGVAHELNNPNTFIRMNTMTLKKMVNLLRPCFDEYLENHPDEKFGPYSLPELKSKMIKLIDDILGASVRIITISDKLKQCSSFSLKEATSLSLKSLIDSILEMHTFLINQVADVEFIHDESQSYQIKGHQLHLEQALSIIFTNACDAIQERFQGSTEKQGKIKIEMKDSDTELKMIFQDNGCGMNEETQIKMFDPYFTTKPQGVGDGLGMALCKAIIERHGGKIEVDSKLGEGTSIVINLPK